ncbi:MAG: ribosome recycling factor [Sphingomonadales bacterium]
MSDEPDLNDIERRMNGAIENLRAEFSGLRTGRASSALLDPIMVDVYGSRMPLNQVGTVSVPEARMLTVQVWDKGNAAAVEKAIRNSGLGLNSMLDGSLVRVPIPELNEERRIEIGKIANKYAEQTKVSIRNVRRDGMDKIKKAEKSNDMSQDEQKMWSEEIQEATNKHITTVDDILSLKEHEIMQI